MIFMLRLLSLGITSMIPIFLTSHYMVRSVNFAAAGSEML